MDDIETIGDGAQAWAETEHRRASHRACRMILFEKFGDDPVLARAERNRRQSSRIYGSDPTRLARTDANLRADGGYFTTTH
ncbi:MAG TPA: hypothetical protein VN043_00035 [Rhodanobacter sp.]|nr:hypothetical protein [Rhodanobacter sp.]